MRWNSSTDEREVMEDDSLECFWVIFPDVNSAERSCLMQTPTHNAHCIPRSKVRGARSTSCQIIYWKPSKHLFILSSIPSSLHLPPPPAPRHKKQHEQRPEHWINTVWSLFWSRLFRRKVDEWVSEWINNFALERKKEIIITHTKKKMYSMMNTKMNEWMLMLK